MSRLAKITGALSALVLLASCGEPGTEVPVEAPAETRTNVILIMADDIGVEAFGAYGGESWSTPEIDKMAAEGMQFMNAHSQPLCTPTRVKIMTGQDNWRNYERFAYMNASLKTFGNMAKDAGYNTMVSGKWQLLRNVRDGQHRIGMQPTQAGFDENFLWQLLPEYRNKRFWEPTFFHNGMLKIYGEDEYGPTLINDHVLEYMERKKDDPFFIYYPMVIPHSPWVTTPDNLTASTREEKFGAMVAYMDKMVGRVKQKAIDLDIADRTVIIFVGDNGTNQQIVSIQNGREVRGGKGLTTDNGTHVPLVVWGAGIKAGVQEEAVVDFADIVPTLVELFDASLPDDHPIDGESMVHLFRGDPGEREDFAFIHYDSKWGDYPAVRYALTPRYKLYENGHFFDTVADPGEQSPLIVTDLGEAAKAVHDKLAAAIASHGNASHFGETVTYDDNVTLPRSEKKDRTK